MRLAGFTGSGRGADGSTARAPVKTPFVRAEPAPRLPPPPPGVILVRPGRVVAVLGVIALALFIASLAGQILKYRFGVVHSFGFVHSFDLDGEVNIPTWFSSALLATCAVLLGVIGIARPRSQEKGAQLLLDLADKPVPRNSAGYWGALSVIFLLMSLDEVAQIHEMTIAPLRTRFGSEGMLFYAWVIPGALFVLTVFASTLPFLARLPRRTRGLFLLAGFIYVSGALGMELVSGAYAAVHGTANLSYALLTHVEESLEMAGCIVMIYALLDYIRSHVGRVSVQVASKSTPHIH